MTKFKVTYKCNFIYRLCVTFVTFW